MRFLFLSETGDGLGLALRLKERGHTVGVSIKDRRCKLNYEGLLDKPSDWSREFLTPDTVVVFDSNGGGKTGDRLRAQGHAVLVGSTIADQLEYDRDVAFEYMSQVGIKLPHYETFHDWQAARDFVKENDQKWVFKPSGQLVKDLTVKSYVASDAEDMIRMLDYYESVATRTPDFELQEFHEGTAISTEGWFNGREFMRPFNHTVERKQVMNDNLGPSGGCAGNLVWAVSSGTDHVIEEGIKRLEPVLLEYGYVGPIDLNTIVNEEGVWALELTPRFGFDALPAFLEVLDGDPAELLASIARLEHPREVRMKDGFGSALRVSVPPYPSEQFQHEGGVPIRGFEREDRPHLFLYDVMLNDKTQLITSPGFGVVAALTGYGMSSTGAFIGPYELAEKAKIPQKMYRTDLIPQLEGDIASFRRLARLKESPFLEESREDQAVALSQSLPEPQYNETRGPL